MQNKKDEITLENDFQIIYCSNDLLEIKIKNVTPTTELINSSISMIEELAKNRKVKLLLDVSDAIPLSSAQREMAARRFEKSVSEMAVVESNLLVILVHRFTMKINKPSFPIFLVKDLKSGRLLLNQ